MDEQTGLTDIEVEPTRLLKTFCQGQEAQAEELKQDWLQHF